MSKVLLVLSHDVEDIEALGTRALLVRSGIEVVTATFQKNLLIETAFGIHVEVDRHVSDLDLNEFDMLVIPGGKYVAETIDLHDKMQVLAKTFYDQGKVIAAICAGPRFLGRAQLLKSKRYTAYPGSEIDIKDGIYEKNQKAITDLPFITAKGAGCVYEFATEIITHLKGHEHASAILKQIQYKD